MAVTASRVKTLFDAEASALLTENGVLTATGLFPSAGTGGVALGQLDQAYWHDNEIPNGVFTVTITVSAIDKTTGNETYVLSLVADDIVDMSDSPTTVASIAVSSTGVYTVALDSQTIAALDTESSGDDKYLALYGTLGGTTPSITATAWIGKVISA